MELVDAMIAGNKKLQQLRKVELVKEI